MFRYDQKLQNRKCKLVLLTYSDVAQIYSTMCLYPRVVVTFSLSSGKMFYVVFHHVWRLIHTMLILWFLSSTARD